MKRVLRWLLVISLFLTAFVLGFVSLNPSPQAPLRDLKDVQALKESFNQDKGVARVILLVSPT